MTLILDVDVIRAMIGGWADHPHEAGLLARQLAVAMARVQLFAGLDVLVPQYLGRVGFIDTLQQLADEVGAQFVELMLLGDREHAVRRFEQRSAHSQEPLHQQAAALQQRLGGPQQLTAAHDQLLAILAARPGCRAITVVDGEADGAYRQLLAALR